MQVEPKGSAASPLCWGRARRSWATARPSGTSNDAAKYAAEYEKQVAATNKLAKEVKKPIFPTMELEKIQVDGTPTLHVDVTLAMNQQVPGVDEILGQLFGTGGKLAVYIAAADEHTMVAGYESKEALQRALKAAKNPAAGIAATPDVAKTAALLPAGAQVIAFISPEGVIEHGESPGSQVDAAGHAGAGPAAVPGDAADRPGHQGRSSTRSRPRSSCPRQSSRRSASTRPPLRGVHAAGQ